MPMPTGQGLLFYTHIYSKCGSLDGQLEVCFIQWAVENMVCSMDCENIFSSKDSASPAQWVIERINSAQKTLKVYSAQQLIEKCIQLSK